MSQELEATTQDATVHELTRLVLRAMADRDSELVRAASRVWEALLPDYPFAYNITLNVSTILNDYVLTWAQEAEEAEAAEENEDEVRA